MFTSVLAFVLAVSLAPAAWAAGGAGGGDGNTGGGGGSGGPGGNSTGSVGAGGGGDAGYAGGDSTSSSGGAAGSQPGGAGGNGGNGLSGANPTGGGGGGGGAYGASLNVSVGPLSSSYTGGNGGTGGDGGNAGANTGGGGGGAGGVGISASVSVTNGTNGVITGGNGGNGGTGGTTGNNGGNGGTGGDGGTGIAFTASGLTFTNAGSVTGGNGGQGGAGNGNGNGGSAGNSGAGGVGITGSGLTIINSGTITGGYANGGSGTQANAITFTGGVNTLELRAGSSISGNVVGTGNDTLTLGGSTSATFDLSTLSQYSGFSTYSKTGTSIWTITNIANMGHGALWSINGGTLEVDGTLTSGTITVNSGGTLSGSGTITDPVINSGAILAPGTVNNIGTLTINGPLTFNAGSFYNVRVTAAGLNDFTQVNGATTINGGTVNVTAGNGSYQTSTLYTILTATGGRTGTFTGVTSNLAFLTPTLTYDADDVFLTLTYTAGGSANYRAAAVNPNQYAVANALTIAALSNPNAPILTALNQLTAAQAQSAFNALSGEGIAAARTAGLQMTGLFSDTISDQSTLWLDGGHNGNEIVMTEAAPGSLGSGVLGYAPSTSMKTPIAVHDPVLPLVRDPVRTWRAWASGFGADETLHGDTSLGSAGQSMSYYGGAMGVDYQINPDLLLGVAGSGSNGNFSVSGRSTYGSVTGGGFGAYGVATYGSYYAASSVSLGFFHNSETRTIAGFGGLNSETDHGGFDSIAVRTRIEAGRRFADVYGATVTPFAALEIANLHSNGFSETPTMGAGVFALNTQGGDTASVPATLGLRFEKRYSLSNGMTLRPVLSLAYGHDFAAERQITNTLLGLAGNPFEISGTRTVRDFAQTKAGFELAFAPNAVAFVNFDGQFSGRDQLYGGKGGVKLTW